MASSIPTKLVLNSSNIGNIKKDLGYDCTLLIHWMPWFGQDSHRNIGYSSKDPIICRKQIKAMKDIGADGLVVDWYGVGTYEDEATLVMMKECEAAGFQFSIMEDEGAFKDANDKGSNLAADLLYVRKTYYPSPLYAHDPLSGGRLLWTFGLGGLTSAQYAAAISFAGLSPVTVMLEHDHPPLASNLGAGNFAWLDTNTDARSYLSWFYGAVKSKFPGATIAGSLFVQFDDHKPDNPTESVWGGPSRYVSPRGGDNWAECMNLAKQFKPPILQVVTWNDHEEGSGIEDVAAILAAPDPQVTRPTPVQPAPIPEAVMTAADEANKAAVSASASTPMVYTTPTFSSKSIRASATTTLIRYALAATVVNRPANTRIEVWAGEVKHYETATSHIKQGTFKFNVSVTPPPSTASLTVQLVNTNDEVLEKVEVKLK